MKYFFVKSIGKLLGRKGCSLLSVYNYSIYIEFPTRLICGIESYFPGMVAVKKLEKSFKI